MPKLNPSLILCIVFYIAACQPEQKEDKQDIIAATPILSERGAASLDECANGGVEFDYGIDQNGNGELEANEISRTFSVCDGDNGADGQNGTSGFDGVNSLVSVSNEPAGSNCAAGGKKVETGMDNGDGGGTPRNNTLEAGEVDNTSYVCNGSDGEDGDDGQSGDDGSNGTSYNSLVSISTENPGGNCAAGGKKVDTGIDNGDGEGTANNNTLESGEVDNTSYICNGSDGATGDDGDSCTLVLERKFRNNRFDYAAGDEPRSVVSGDIDGDGDLDVLIANHGEDDISVLLNNGDGTFAAKADYAVGDEPYTIALGDIDGDGDLDVLAACRGANDGVSVLKNNGDGTFADEVDIDTGLNDELSAAILGDVDNDGDLDGIITFSGLSAVSILYNNGSGSFTLAGGYPVQSGPLSLAQGDLNQDGHLDIVTGDSNANTMSVLLNDGDGTFTVHGTAPATGTTPYSITLGDVDGDGNLDALTANGTQYEYSATTAYYLSVLIGNGDGTFAAKVDYAIGESGKAISLDDVDGDGDLDALTANYDADGSISVLKNNGNGTFAAKEDYKVGANPWALTLGDVDGDGDLDVLSGNYADDNISVLLNEGNGTFDTQEESTVGDEPFAIALGDVDGDGDADVLTANEADADISVLLNNGDGTFAEKDDYVVGNSPRSIALGDVDADGDVDALTANKDDGKISVLLNDGDGTFTPKEEDDAVGTAPRSIALGDVDGDGDVDALTANSGDNDISVLLNNGDGGDNLWDGFAGEDSYAVGNQPYSIALGDVDGDGDADALTANLLGNDISVLLNNGDGGDNLWDGFADEDSYAVGNQPYSIALGDVDGDGDVDVLTTNHGDNDISVLLNEGDTDSNGVWDGFAAKDDYAVGNYPDSMALGDVDGDGDMDVLATNYGDNNISVLLNNGDGTFAAKADYTVGDEPRSIALGDVDGDGDMDALTANHGADSISVLLNYYEVRAVCEDGTSTVLISENPWEIPGDA